MAAAAKQKSSTDVKNYKYLEQNQDKKLTKLLRAFILSSSIPKHKSYHNFHTLKSYLCFIFSVHLHLINDFSNTGSYLVLPSVNCVGKRYLRLSIPNSSKHE